MNSILQNMLYEEDISSRPALASFTATAANEAKQDIEKIPELDNKLQQPVGKNTARTAVTKNCSIKSKTEVRD